MQHLARIFPLSAPAIGTRAVLKKNEIRNDICPKIVSPSFLRQLVVIEFYNKGGEAMPGKDVLMTPLNLNDQEKKDLVEFLKGLTGEVMKVSPPKLP
jgi:hypothetical protein